LPLVGGATFLGLFANANPLIGWAFSQIVLPDPWATTWRALFGLCVLITIWASLRPSPYTTGPSRFSDRSIGTVFELGAVTLILSLVTFNTIFAVENVLDIVFLWRGAGLPSGVTMADYAHRGAYSLIVTALLAGVFVLLALRPGSAAAASPRVRRLVAVWLVQNLLLVASSVLRTLDYVDAYGMTVLRVTASVVDLGAVAAAWNVRTALEMGKAGPPRDLCYMGRLGPSSLVSLATLEQHAREPQLRDRLTYLRWERQTEKAGAQADWRL
jgi:hypothetical protein